MRKRKAYYEETSSKEQQYIKKNWKKFVPKELQNKFKDFIDKLTLSKRKFPNKKRSSKKSRKILKKKIPELFE